MKAAQSSDSVTLVVYGWHENRPGTLAWVFPSSAAALRAVVAMPNAEAWAILHGERRVEAAAFELEALRSAGLVVVERR